MFSFHLPHLGAEQVAQLVKVLLVVAVHVGLTKKTILKIFLWKIQCSYVREPLLSVQLPNVVVETDSVVQPGVTAAVVVVHKVVNSGTN